MPDTTINGFKHHWEEAGTGDVLLMLHSAAGSGAQFRPHFAELSKTFRIIAPDMRSMGQSEHLESIAPNAWSADVGGLLDHLEITNCSVYGTSLGARVALRFVIDNPERVRTLILDNPIIANESGGNAALNARLGDPEALPQAAQDRYRSFHGEDWAQVVRSYFSIRNEPALQEHYNLRELAKAVETPTLITRGDSREDITHPLPHAVELAYSLKNSRLWIKPAGGCLATPEGYDVIRNWVAEHAEQTVSA